MMRLNYSRWYIFLVLIIVLACNALTRPVERSGVLGPGSFYYPDPRSGLGELSSYKQTLSVTFEGTEKRKTFPWTMTTVMNFSTDHEMRILAFERSENIAKGEPTLVAEMDGAAYEVGSDGTCFATVLDPANSLAIWLEPIGQLSGVLGAEEAGHEVLNGIDTDHYTFDERAIAQDGLNKSTGEIWVASEGGYIVRYHLTTQGDEDYFGDGVEGTFTWDYELTEVNQPTTLHLPEDCPPGLVDAPLLQDATSILKVPGFLKYTTASSVKEAAEFYNEQLPSLGWELPSATEVPEGVSPEEYEQVLESMQALGMSQSVRPEPNATEVFLEYQQEDQALSIIITKEEAVTVVNLLLSRRRVES